MKNYFDLLLADLAGEHGKSRRIISTILLGVVLLLFIYIIVRYGEFILGIALITVLIVFYRQYSGTDIPKPVCCPFYNLIRSCLFEAVSVSTDSTTLKRPVSEYSLDTIQHPLASDGVQRYEYYIRLAAQSLTVEQTDSVFIKEVLSNELNHSFQQNSYLFKNLCLSFQGIYIERLSAKAGGFIIVIIPVCEKTLSYVDKHRKQQLIQNLNQTDSRRPQDDLF